MISTFTISKYLYSKPKGRNLKSYMVLRILNPYLQVKGYFTYSRAIYMGLNNAIGS